MAHLVDPVEGGPAPGLGPPNHWAFDGVHFAPLHVELHEGRAACERGGRPLGDHAVGRARVQRRDTGEAAGVPAKVVHAARNAVVCRATLGPEAPHEPRFPLQRRVVAAPVGGLHAVGHLATARRDLELDDLGPLAAVLHDGVQRRASDTYGFQLVVHLVGEGDVRFGEELAYDPLPGLGLHVEHDALLPNHLLGLPRHHHHGSVIGQLRPHLVYRRAQLGHHAPAGGPSNHVGEIDDRVTL
mmetsp:Transcript_70090/g.194852  ORF Transcript_70090/g.194852 Transcript_70090/m.194852 type:complete len:242 (-) Transcript_70090:1431-2156(-)